jgi:hypothetical protein
MGWPGIRLWEWHARRAAVYGNTPIFLSWIFLVPAVSAGIGNDKGQSVADGMRSGEEGNRTRPVKTPWPRKNSKEIIDFLGRTGPGISLNPNGGDGGHGNDDEGRNPLVFEPPATLPAHPLKVLPLIGRRMISPLFHGWQTRRAGVAPAPEPRPLRRA